MRVPLPEKDVAQGAYIRARTWHDAGIYCLIEAAGPLNVRLYAAALLAECALSRSAVASLSLADFTNHATRS